MGKIYFAAPLGGDVGEAIRGRTGTGGLLARLVGMQGPDKLSGLYEIPFHSTSATSNLGTPMAG